MKELFPGYQKKSQEEITTIWNDGSICFDANVLLNLYRYSKETRETLLKLVDKLNEKIWLPHQSALEYNRNRYEVIANQEKTYKQFIDKISQIQKELKSTSKPPFLSESVHNSLNEVFEEVNKEVDENIEKYKSYLKDDPLYNSISKLFEGKISEPYPEERINEICTNGEERYENNIPPGYKDKDKNGRRKYGDLILWNQIIDKAKELNAPIILITDERKEDWWWKIKDGRTIGPRQELVEEIKNKADVNFHMYSSEKFLSYGQKYLKEQVNEKALEEIQEMKKAELKRLRNLEAHNKMSEENLLITQHQIRKLQEEYSDINREIEKYREDLDDVKKHDILDSNLKEYIHSNNKYIAQLEEQREKIKSRLNHLYNKFDKTDRKKILLEYLRSKEESENS